MSVRTFLEREEVRLESTDLSTWPMVFIENLCPKDRELFIRRRKAVELYLTSSDSVQSICDATGVARQHLYRLLMRCLQTDETGVIWGYRGLIPYKRIAPYHRTVRSEGAKISTAPGAFMQLLETYPKLKDTIDDLFLRSSNRSVTEPVIALKHVHGRFVRACKALGLSMNEYPFNTKNLGRKALERYLRKLSLNNFSLAAARYGENAGRRANHSNPSGNNHVPVSRPFQRVEFDAHRIDVLLAITYHTPEGDEVTEIINRIWLLAIIDVATRSILGHHLSLNKEYTSADVLECIRKAVMPWTPKKLTIPGLAYPDEIGFHSAAIPDTQWGVWDEFSYDNAKANLSKAVISRLRDVIGCSINAGPIKWPEYRSIIERFFKILEDNGYHRLPSTTGSGSHDPRRRNPEQQAVKYSISFEHLQELTEVIVAEYNLTPHAGTNYLTPLETMQQRLAHGMTIRQLPPTKQEEVSFLSYQAKRTIKGNVKTGTRPYVQFEGVRYTNEVLARSPALIGTQLDLFVNMEDLRTLRAFLPDGSELGRLTAAGKWGVTPHNLQVRKHINRLRERKLIHFTSRDDPIEVYLRYLQGESARSRKSRTQLLQVNNMLGVDQSEPESQLNHTPKDNKIPEMPYTTTAQEPTSVPEKMRKTISY